MLGNSIDFWNSTNVEKVDWWTRKRRAGQLLETGGCYNPFSCRKIVNFHHHVMIILFLFFLRSISRKLSHQVHINLKWNFLFYFWIKIVKACPHAPFLPPPPPILKDKKWDRGSSPAGCLHLVLSGSCSLLNKPKRNFVRQTFVDIWLRVYVRGGGHNLRFACHHFTLHPW